MYFKFKHALFDAGNEFGTIIGPYVFRMRLPIPVNRIAIKKMILNTWECFSRFRKAEDRPSFRIFLKDTFPNIDDCLSKGLFVVTPRKIQETPAKYQYQKESYCLLDKNRKDES